VFIPASQGIKITKIDQDTQQLYMKIKWHVFMDNSDVPLGSKVGKGNVDLYSASSQTPLTR